MMIIHQIVQVKIVINYKYVNHRAKLVIQIFIVHLTFRYKKQSQLMEQLANA